LTPENAEEKAFVAGLLAFLRDPQRPYRKELQNLLKSMFGIHSKPSYAGTRIRRKII
jgi:hypothetical protein